MKSSAIHGILHSEKKKGLNAMLVIASDHGGFALKQEIMAHLQGRGVAYEDIGTYNTGE